MNAHERHGRVSELFTGAAALPESDRADWLDQQTAGDPGLKADVLALLAADSAPAFIDSDALTPAFRVAIPEMLAAAEADGPPPPDHRRVHTGELSRRVPETHLTRVAVPVFI